MSATSELRVGVTGAGLMGADHIARLSTTITGATVSAVIDPDEGRARAAATAPGAATFARIEDALDAGTIDAVVVATPGQYHEAVLLPALEAGLPILCEKPLTQDPESSWRILEAEQKTGKRLIQVGFMRRFDPQYRQMRELIASGTAGELLMVRGVHRNPAVPPESYTQLMLITDSVVHEFDVIPWLAGSTIKSVEVRYGKRNALSPDHLREPILVLMELDNGVLADVEMNVSIQFGYQVGTEAVLQRGVARIGQPEGLQLWQDGTFQIGEHQSFKTRFKQAFDTQVQDWVNAARRGETGGPSAWDGYKVAVACAAGVEALATRGPVSLDLPETPAFYSTPEAP